MNTSSTTLSATPAAPSHACPSEAAREATAWSQIVDEILVAIQGWIESQRPPRATYRVQFNHDFTFPLATDLVPYLNALGVSDVYASPYFKAAAGSTHGYDIVDRSRSFERRAL